MKRILFVGVLAGIVALCMAKAALPIAGTWEGMDAGVKSATLVVSETEGKLGGRAIFYIVHDEGSGTHNGAATPALEMLGMQWDGHLLRFHVVTTGGTSIAFELRVTGEGKAELVRPEQDGMPELTVVMSRAR